MLSLRLFGEEGMSCVSFERKVRIVKRPAPKLRANTTALAALEA